MSLAFAKMHGAGNDFVLIDTLREQAPLTPELVQQLADRRYGAGADQVLTIERGAQLPFAYSIYNADGSSAGQCGNGARCVGAYLHRHYGLPRGFTVESPAGPVSVRIFDNGEVEVDLGVPRLNPAEVPTTLQPDAAGVGSFQALRRSWQGSPVSMGNPHLVIEVPDVAHAPLAELGAWLQVSELFPQGCNLGMVQVLDANTLRLRVYERGVGETLACGSGACAAAVAMQTRGRASGPLRLELPGGRLRVRWDGPGKPAFLAGGAEFVYAGQWQR